MNDKKKAVSCFSCGRTDVDVPLLVLRYLSQTLHICPQCLPLLIHHFDRLAEKLPGG